MLLKDKVVLVAGAGPAIRLEPDASSVLVAMPDGGRSADAESPLRANA